MNLQQRIILIIVVSALTPLAFRALVNVFGLMVDSQDVYHIPRGSSLFTFRPTEWNPGSGDWWIYGEDNRYYYYFEDDLKLSKRAVETCQGFLKDSVSTWCLDQ
jgi:hypothetical protein